MTRTARLKLARGTAYTINMATKDAQEEPVRLVGFQNEAGVQRVSLFVTDWEKDPQSAVGKFPVFSSGKGLFVVTLPIESVEVSGVNPFQIRLEYLRREIEAERISTSEIAELQDLAPHIDPSDTLLLEWAGVPEGSEPKTEPNPYESALKTVLEAAGSWLNEMDEYIIPASKAADDGCEYDTSRDELDRAIKIVAEGRKK
jgi:hypothetical protein